MRLGTFLTIFILFTFSCFSQQFTNKENGGYTDYVSLINDRPAYKFQFQIVKRTNNDIRSRGGNDYQINCKNEIVDDNTINKIIWCIIQDDTLFMNGQFVIGVKGYVKVELVGKFSFLHAAYPTKHKILKELGIDSPNSEVHPGYMYGALGGAIEGLNQSTPISLPRIPLIFDMETGKRMLLTKLTLMQLLKNHEFLLKDYLSEPDNTREIILLKYLKKLNELD